MENIKWRRSRRAKNILLSVSMDGTIELVVPWRVPYQEAEVFLREKREWLRRALSRYAKLRDTMPTREFVTGETVLCLGREYVLQVEYENDRQRSHLDVRDNKLRVKGRDKAMVKAAVTGWYKRRAKEYFTDRSQDYAVNLGVSVKTIAISQAKTQWGSCNARTKRLSYNWRLLLGPLEVAEYVIAHEVAHLKHQNHSKAFWETVKWLDPDYKEKRKWLKKNGYRLVL